METGPYIVTKYRHEWRNSHTCTCPSRAVATLEKARVACHDVLTTCDLNPAAQFDAQYAIQYRVGKSGGTVTLPDGHEIEVKPVADVVLREACPLIFSSDWLNMSVRERCDAYNDAQKEA